MQVKKFKKREKSIHACGHTSGMGNLSIGGCHEFFFIGVSGRTVEDRVAPNQLYNKNAHSNINKKKRAYL